MPSKKGRKPSVPADQSETPELMKVLKKLADIEGVSVPPLYWLLEEQRLVPSAFPDPEIIEGNIYEPYIPDRSFKDWLQFFIRIAKKKKSFEVSQLKVLFQLMRKEDLEELESKLNVEEIAGVDKMYFSGGHYSKVRSFESWDIKQEEYLRLEYSDGGTLDLQRGLLFEVCEKFQELGIIGNAPSMVGLYTITFQVCAGINRYSDHLPNILIQGEPGTGKELLARAIHKLSGRDKKEFRSINCAAIPDTLLESELFGHVMGAFTGAMDHKIGIFEVCNGGTVQLDEIDKMTPNLQAKMFRALQEKQIQRLGKTEPTKIDVLFISTTNEDLTPKGKGGNGSLETALYGRLSGVTLKIPPLRDRAHDIPLLVNHFLQKYLDNDVDMYRFPVALWCMNQVKEMDNNVRSLENLVRRLVYRFLNPLYGLTDLRKTELRSTAYRLYEEEGKPISQAKLADAIRKGRSTLQDQPYKTWIQELIEKGVVRPRRQSVR